ncbi:MAG: DUF294 nucleotidyltransferase-like domain-containing protein [Bacteroidota bacterium]
MQPSNTIVGRVGEFLAKYPPFDLLPKEELDKLASHVMIRFEEDAKVLFQKDDPPGDHFFVLKTGSVLIYDKDENLVDQCDEGDIFGVRSMLSGKPYVLKAVVDQEALIYELPNVIFKPLLEKYPNISVYFASGLASGQTVIRKEEQATHLPENELQALNLDEKINTEGKKKLISANADTSIQAVAELMTQHGVGSMIIVNDQHRPVGIITDTDLRKQVATGQVSISAEVNEIMNSPVITVANGLPAYEVVLKMIENGVHHLCITVDGTDQSKAIGVVSERDLLLIHSNDPAVLLKEIKQVNDLTRLPGLRDKAEGLVKHYLENEVSIAYISQVISAINDALIRKAIANAERQLEETGVEAPNADFCWLSLGSEGREEQLLRTDQDNAIIFKLKENGDDAKAKSYFLALAEKVTETLADCGFVKCPADIMASNPKWCTSIDEWTKYFQGWVKTPDPKALMFSTIFFDYRCVYGNGDLVQALDERLKSLMDGEKILLNYLAKNATLNPPPLSFFKGFVVERSGEHEDQFDLKLRAMMPLADAARVLSLDLGILNKKNTIQRFQAVAEADEKNARLYQEAAQAYDILMRTRVLSGLENGDSGRYVPIDGLSKFDKQRLRNAFDPINDLQKLLEVRYQLSYFQT